MRIGGLKKLFEAFGPSKLGQLAAAIIVGGLLPLLMRRKAEIPDEDLPFWCVAGAVTGGAVALVLLWRDAVVKASREAKADRKRARKERAEERRGNPE